MTIKEKKKFCFSIILPLVCFFLIIILSGCSNEEQKNEKDVNISKIGIIIKDGSYIRLDPVLYSTVVAYTKLGEKAGILDQSKEKTWIGNTSDYWYKIRISGGLTGWTFGTNLKIFSDVESDDINSFLKKLWKSERGKLLEKLMGRWWSVDRYDNFTNQCVEIYNDGKYKSYCANCAPIEGDYEIRYKTYEIVFSKGTSFGDRVKYIMRGDVYILKKTGQDELKFKRIKRKFDDTDTEDNPAGKDAKPD